MKPLKQHSTFGIDGDKGIFFFHKDNFFQVLSTIGASSAAVSLPSLAVKDYVFYRPWQRQRKGRGLSQQRRGKARVRVPLAAVAVAGWCVAVCALTSLLNTHSFYCIIVCASFSGNI